MQPVWLCMLWSKCTEVTFENTQWRKTVQMQPMWLCIFSGKPFEDTFENAQWRKVEQMQPVHYWLRWSIGFWNVQKVDKSRQLFLIQKTHQVIFAACFELVMTHILRRKKIWWRWYGIIGQNYGKCSKKVEDGLIRGWFFVWWKYRPYWEKKLKISTSNETVFMVKLKL